MSTCLLFAEPDIAPFLRNGNSHDLMTDHQERGWLAVYSDPFVAWIPHEALQPQDMEAFENISSRQVDHHDSDGLAAHRGIFHTYLSLLYV